MMEGRGWNDTPQVINQNPTGKLKISLNKRVAFPLQKPAGDPAATSLSQPAAPPLGSLPPPPPSLLPSATVPSDENSLESKASFEPSLEIERISKIFQECLQAISQPPAVQSSLKAKLKTLEDEWSTFDLELQKLLSELADFVEKKDAKGAAGVQRKIIMQGHNKQWMHAIRQIILNLEANEKEEQPEEASTLQA